MVGPVRHWEAQLQVARRLVMVALIGGRQTHCNGGFQAVLGLVCRWWHCVFGECNCRLPNAL